jgi:hypothetical protein
MSLALACPWADCGCSRSSEIRVILTSGFKQAIDPSIGGPEPANYVGVSGHCRGGAVAFVGAKAEGAAGPDPEAGQEKADEGERRYDVDEC